ncbi:type 4a pilus biogenesis protein PilO [Candidatus Kaiserbacteria bacterium]|nr:type 4a pilus biogenesis protein PilO [Candidatus Kaiserbacteria bacterium]
MGRTIIAVVGFVLAGAIFFLYTKPTYDGVQGTRNQIAQYDAALQKAAELQQLKQSLLARYNAFDPAQVDRLQKLLPDHVDNVRLILDLDNIAGRHGMAIQNVVVSTPQRSDGRETAVGTISASKQKYDSLTMKFTTQGTYQSFQEFLNDLETSLRIVDLASLKVARSDATRAGEPLYSFDITLRTYWLK